jgi:hypothetical protein
MKTEHIDYDAEAVASYIREELVPILRELTEAWEDAPYHSTSPEATYATHYIGQFMGLLMAGHKVPVDEEITAVLEEMLDRLLD